MKIGELAARSGCPVETIRYYERAGLLPPPGRSANNYRAYGERHAERLQFIRHCRALDMSQDEIRALLAFRDNPGKPCDGVGEVLDRHIGHVAERIAALSHLEAQLRQLRTHCLAPDASGACGILHALGDSAAAPATKPGVHGSPLDATR